MCFEKMKIKKKEAGNGPFKKILILSYLNNLACLLERDRFDHGQSFERWTVAFPYFIAHSNWTKISLVNCEFGHTS